MLDLVTKSLNVFFFSIIAGEYERVSEADLSSSPVSSFGIVSDFIISSISDPVRQVPIFLDHNTDLLFFPESLD